MASATPFGGGNQPIFQKYLAGYGPDSPIMRASYRNAGGAVGPLGAGGAGAGALPGTYDPAHGGIPNLPTSNQMLQNLLESISGNLGNLGPIISGITGAQQNALLQQFSPQYKEALGTIGTNVANRAAGDISDLIPNIAQGAGEWGIGSGLSGGPAASSKLARDLGLTTYQVQREAADDINKLRAATPTVNPYDPARLLPGYDDQSGLDIGRSIYGSAPIPFAAAAEAERLARLGLSRGFNAGGGGGFNWFNPMGRPNLGAVAPPAGGGGGASPFFAPGNSSLIAARAAGWTPPAGGGVLGPLPPGAAGMQGFPGGQGPPWQNGPSWEESTPNLWDQPFDMPQDWGGDFFNEDLFM